MSEHVAAVTQWLCENGWPDARPGRIARHLGMTVKGRPARDPDEQAGWLESVGAARAATRDDLHVLIVRRRDTPPGQWLAYLPIERLSFLLDGQLDQPDVAAPISMTVADMMNLIRECWYSPSKQGA